MTTAPQPTGRELILLAVDRGLLYLGAVSRRWTIAAKDAPEFDQLTCDELLAEGIIECGTLTHEGHYRIERAR